MGSGSGVPVLFGLLRRDHAAIVEMLAAVGRGDGDVAELFAHLARDLVVHEVAEEEVVYAAVRRYVDGGDDLADAALAEQHHVEQLLAVMAAMGPDNVEWEAALTALTGAVIGHIGGEERNIFAVLQDAMSADRLEILADTYLDAKAANSVGLFEVYAPGRSFCG